MNFDSSMYSKDQFSESLGASLSIALIGPDEDRRRAVASALAGCQGGDTREFSTYPLSLDDLPKLLEQQYDVIILELDSHPQYALELVESICANDSATVMVYSEQSDQDLLVRCMRAGAREFLTLPFAQSIMAEALVRAMARRPATRPEKKAGGRLLAFLGAKGGDGATTLACNFAVSLAQESGQSTLLIDLDLPLGDAALNLGVTAQYSAINALENANRLDSSFLSTLLVKHNSGVSVLAAPGKFPQFDASDEAVDRLLSVARQEFDNVVVDMGSRLDLMGTSLFKSGSTIYLVIQASIAGLRNSNRLISQYFATGVPKLEIVLNRFSRSLGIDEGQITKALTRRAEWKIPNDYNAVRRMHHTAVPLAMEDSAISRLIHQMARSACGLPVIPEKETKEKGSGFRLKKRGRSDDSSFTQLGLVSGPNMGYAPHVAAQPEARANRPEDTAYAAEIQSPAATPAPFRPAESAETAHFAEAREETALSASTPYRVDRLDKLDKQDRQNTQNEQSEPETRSFQGATYVKGADGEWHLIETPERAVKHVAAKAVRKQMPVIEWQEPASIVYGERLSTTQLNAMASVPGRFAYIPAAGEVLSAGMHVLTVTFTPADAARYATAQDAVPLAVDMAKTVVAWAPLSSISYGAALSSAQLDATASVPGVFVYTPAAGEVLPAGIHTLTAKFNPADAENYAAAEVEVSLVVTKTTPVITWPMPATIAYGKALSVAQLNATASVQGSIKYTPAAGEVLSAGIQKLSAEFTPKDTANYATAQATVALFVSRIAPVITWPAPAAISFGEALSATQLNATASVPGAFVYTPDAGEVIEAGAHMLSVTFTPADAAGYTTVQASVPLTIVAAKPIIASPTPAPAKAVSVQARDVEPPVIPAFVKAPAEAPARQRVKAAPMPPAQAPVKPLVVTPVEIPVVVQAQAPAPRFESEAGSELDLMGTAVFPDGTTIYLVVQPGSTDEQHINRLVSQFLSGEGSRPAIVMNRYEPRNLSVGEGQTTEALSNSDDSPISRLTGQMDESYSDLDEAEEKKSSFSLEGLKRSIWAKVSAGDNSEGFTQLGLASVKDNAGATRGATQSGATKKAPSRSANASHAGTRSRGSIQEEPETRTYRGALYVKGANGEWHLQASSVKTESPAIDLSVPDSIAYDAAFNLPEFITEFQPALPTKKAPAKANANASAKPVKAKGSASNSAPAKKRSVAASSNVRTGVVKPSRSAVKNSAPKPAKKRLGNAESDEA